MNKKNISLLSEEEFKILYIYHIERVDNLFGYDNSLSLEIFDEDKIKLLKKLMELKYVDTDILIEIKNEAEKELYLTIKFLIMCVFLVNLTKMGTNISWSVKDDFDPLIYSSYREVGISKSVQFTVWNFLTPVVDTINILLTKIMEKLGNEKIILKYKKCDIIPLEHIVIDENCEIKKNSEVDNKSSKRSAYILEKTLYGVFVNCCHESIIMTVSNLKMYKKEIEKKKKSDIENFCSIYEEMETKFNTDCDLPTDYRKSNILYSLNIIVYNIKFDNGLLKKPMIYEKLKNGDWIMTNNHWSNVVAVAIKSSKTIFKNKISDETIKTIEKSNSIKRYFCRETCNNLIGLYFKKFEINSKFELIKKYEMISHRLINNIKINYTNGISDNSTKLNEMKNVLWLFDCLENNKGEEDNNYFYTWSTHDFRGRIYYNQPFSITDNKILRSVIYEKMDNEKRKRNTIDNFLITLFNENYILLSRLFDVNILKKWENKVDILNIIIKVGTILRDKNLKEFYGVNEIIEIGVNGYVKKTYNKDIHDNSQLYLCYKILEQISQNVKEKKNYYIEKDAIGSVFQIIGLRCGVYKDKANVLNFLNTGLTCTYCYIKNLFLIEENVNPKYHLYFSRKHVKNLMMTVGYGATKKAAVERWLESINRKELKWDSEIVQIFIKLFDYIYGEGLKKIYKKDFKEVLFNEVYIDRKKNYDVRSFVHYKNEKFCWLYSTNNIKRILPILKKNKINLSKKRISFTDDEKNEINIRKSRVALRANYAHFLDSLIMRSLIYDMPNVLSVHDCALFPYTKNSEVILSLNKTYNKMYKNFNKDMDFKIENILIWS